MRTIANTDLSVFPLCLGSNIFGWTADERESFAVLDAYAAAGGNFIDTADSYSAWVDGNTGGEAETIIGRWMSSRGNRDAMVVATKVGKTPGLEGLAPATIRRAAEDSLKRLETDRIDLYYAHMDDEDTPIEDSLATFGELIAEGKVRHIAASNYTAPRLAAALELARGGELPAYVAVQPAYNLLDRDEFEGPLPGSVRARGCGLHPVLRRGQGLPDRQVPPRRPRGELAARRLGAGLSRRSRNRDTHGTR